MLVDLPEELVKFAKELANEIDTQDNAATGKPYFVVVKTKVFGACVDERSTEPDEIQYISKEDHEDVLTEAEYNELPEGLVKDDYQRNAIVYYEAEENVFFTWAAAKNFMDNNKHNLSEPRLFLKHAFRNRQMGGLFKLIEAFKDVKVENNT